MARHEKNFNPQQQHTEPSRVDEVAKQKQEAVWPNISKCWAGTRTTARTSTQVIRDSAAAIAARHEKKRRAPIDGRLQVFSAWNPRQMAFYAFLTIHASNTEWLWK